MSALLRLAFASILLWVCVPAAANISCTSMVAPNVTIYYVNNTTISMQSTFTVYCRRSSAADPASLTYDVTHNVGNSPTATNGGSTLFYTLGRSSCADQWRGNGGSRNLTDTVSMPSVGTSYPQQTSFFVCINTPQTAGAAGLYRDVVTLTANTPGINPTASFQVNITAPASCVFTTPPGNINLLYLALDPNPVAASTIFKVRCTAGMPYTLATDVMYGVHNNVRYQLTLDAAGGNGNGSPQQYTITATAFGGQSGCAGAACSATPASHQVIISY